MDQGTGKMIEEFLDCSVEIFQLKNCNHNTFACCMYLKFSEVYFLRLFLKKSVIF